ncbi:MAG TPA: rhombosortase [Cellvibrionales bacterium]|nr:rhombosortase [Cellvibrionales bacterium]
MDNSNDKSNNITAKYQLLLERLPQLAMALLIAALLFIFTQAELLASWRFDRFLFDQQPILALSHAFVHLNAQHLMLNISGLVFIYLIFPSAFKSLLWIIALTASAVASAYGIFYYSPETEWLVGLSGALHGLFVYAALRSRASIAWLVAIIIKLVIEQMPSLMPTNNLTQMTEQFISNPVIVDAHLWGAAGGLLFFFVARSIATLFLIVELNRDEK